MKEFLVILFSIICLLPVGIILWVAAVNAVRSNIKDWFNW